MKNYTRSSEVFKDIRNDLNIIDIYSVISSVVLGWSLLRTRNLLWFISGLLKIKDLLRII